LPVDPELQTMLEMVNQYPPVHLGTVAEGRAGLETMATLMSKPDIASVREIAIPGPAGELRARVYDNNPGTTGPAVVYYHGGGHTVGSLETCDHTCRGIAQDADCVVVSVDYQLAPEHKFPAAAEDAYAAAVWVHKHAAELGVTPGVTVAGDSAGGNLAAVASLMARDAGSAAIAHQFLIYPGTGHDPDSASARENAERLFLWERDVAWFGANYIGSTDDVLDWRFSPMRASSLAGVASATVITAEYDPLRDEGDAYAGRLAAEGVPVTHLQFPGMIHGFIDMGDFSPGARAAVDKCIAALRTALDRTAARAV
jgi:acetyl esterase